MNEPFISIIVPAYNSEKKIKKCIESLLNIDYSNYEILIVDDGSTDKTKDILFEYKDRINIIENQHSGPSKCRNIAAKQAKGDFIAFTDSDCLVDKNWIKELLKGFIDEKVAGVGGIQLSPQDETEFGKSVQEFFELTGFLGGYIKSKNKGEIIKVPHNPSCNVMYRKDAFLEISGFDENLWPCEDVDLDYRLKKKGYIFMFNPNAIIYHYRPQSLKNLSKMMYRYGFMQGILTKRYGFFRKIQFIPILFIALLVLFFLNNNFLWLVLFLYLFIILKLRHLFIGSIIFLLLILTGLAWNCGMTIGILSRNR